VNGGLSKTSAISLQQLSAERDEYTAMKTGQYVDRGGDGRICDDVLRDVKTIRRPRTNCSAER
jgi:hypothetical protein